MGQTAAASICAYKVWTVPVFNYVAQLDIPTVDFCKDLHEWAYFHKILRVIPGTFPMAVFPNLHVIGVEPLVPFKLLAISIRIRTARKTLKASYQSYSQLYWACVSVHGTLMKLMNRFNCDDDGFDTPAMIENLERALVLDELPHKVREGVKADISALDVHLPGYQTQVCSALVRHMFPFSWEQFLRRRVVVTYHYLAGNLFIPQVRFDIIILWLRSIRPVLVVSFLRWILNSLPTSGRIHDGLYCRCPVCGHDSDHISHLIDCNALFKHAASALISRGFLRMRMHDVHILRDGMPFVGCSSESVLLGVYRSNDSPPIRRDALYAFNRLGLMELDHKWFVARVHVLYVSQLIFIGARKIACDMLADHSVDRPIWTVNEQRLSSLAQAAVSSLR